MQSNPRRQFTEILGDAEDMTVATVRADGWPQANVVSFVADGQAIYFRTAAESRKANNLAYDRRVSATVVLPHATRSDIRGVSLAGRAVAVTDPDELSRVGKLFADKFPRRGEYVGPKAPETVMFRIDVEFASVLDYRQAFGEHELIGMR